MIRHLHHPAAALALLLPLLLGACGGDPFWLPRAHKISIQQGNILSDEQFQRLKPGMPREEVRLLIGAPVVVTPFHADRWDYVYTEGPAGSQIVARRASLVFENDVLARIEHNHDEESGKKPMKRYWWEAWRDPEDEPEDKPVDEPEG